MIAGSIQAFRWGTGIGRVPELSCVKRSPVQPDEAYPVAKAALPSTTAQVGRRSRHRQGIPLRVDDKGRWHNGGGEDDRLRHVGDTNPVYLPFAFSSSLLSRALHRVEALHRRRS